MKNLKQNKSLINTCFAMLLIGNLAVEAQDGATTATIKIEPAATENTKGIRLNFRNAPVDTVLDHLSKAAGFVIIREVTVEGRVDIVSHQPLTNEEAVNLLNSVLYSKGYAAIRNDRTLTIVSKDDAKKQAIPVILGNDPEQIPKNDVVVTQIIPVRYVEAAKLIDNVKALMASNATISANETSNAIVLTDTQKNIRRIVEIIKALDSSISEITTLKVFLLKYSDAKEMAKLINQIYEVPKTSSSSSSRGGWGRPSSDNGSRSSSTSVALQSTRRVKAVADERTNAVVVSAPEDYIPSIEKLIIDTDMSDELITEFRVFPLKYAKAEEMAETLNSIFNPDEAQSNNSRTNNSSRSSGGREEFFRRMMGGGSRSSSSNNKQQVSQRELESSQVSCVADERTNSVIVSAEKNMMTQVEKIVQRLDSNSGKNQKVFVYSLDNAEAGNVAEILDSMFNGGSGNLGNNNNNTNTNRTNTNTTTRNNNFGRN